LVGQDASATFIQCDVTKEEQVENMFNQIKEKFGRLDVLFNNAGIATFNFLPFHEKPLDVVREVIETNQIGAWCVMK